MISNSMDSEKPNDSIFNLEFPTSECADFLPVLETPLEPSRDWLGNVCETALSANGEASLLSVQCVSCVAGCQGGE